MRKIYVALGVLMMVGACAKHDPILPGMRTSIFGDSTPNILNAEIADLPATAVVAAPRDDAKCPYVQDSSNVIRNGDKKIFSGFPTTNSVATTQYPICSGGYVIAGLTTGEVVRINPKTRAISWIADVYKASNVTGGASVLDIVAPIIATDNSIYVGGMGDAFCRLNMSNGAKKWCTEISVNAPFVIAGPAAFVIGTDGTLNAVRTDDGAIYWRADITGCDNISYENKIITACRKKIDAATGKKIK
ncbi:PQQ-binding-like beta-propeller repeat protein [bacterium]|nr:PQQ-binding-like beta-propeller repeat protein [bacterium]